MVEKSQGARKQGPCGGMLGVERIMLAGNSCGGVTALQTAAFE